MIVKSVLGSLVALAALIALALPIAAQDAASDGEVVRMYVGPETAECVGVAPQQCLLISMSPEGEPEFFYDEIVGFSHEPGTAAVLDVLVQPVENPPADGSSLKYSLIDIIE
jgi:hypothetical protein